MPAPEHIRALAGHWRVAEPGENFQMCFEEDGWAATGVFDYAYGGAWFATPDYLTLDYSHGRFPPFQLKAWRYRLQGDRLFLKQDERQEFEMIHLSRSCKGDWFQPQGG